MKINIKRLQRYFDEMSEVGKTENGGVSRLALSSGDKEARDLFVKWLKDAGLKVRFDDVGNIYGRKEGTDPEADPIVIGSHLDSIEDGGKYDGVLGIITGLEIIHTLSDYSISTRRPIEIGNFTNEEGVRFESLMGGSGVLSNDYDLTSIYNEKDNVGKTFIDELKGIDYLGDRKNRLKAAEAFIELHIEQGPVLDKEEIPIGIVEGILGFTWLSVTVTGETNTSGPTPMYLRKDALSSAARMIVEIEKLASKVGENAITTVGIVEVKPGHVNSIPGEVRFTVDIRDEDPEKQQAGVQMIKDCIRTIADNDTVEFEITELMKFEPTNFSPKVIEALAEAVDELGYPSKRMISGAGHISTYMNNLCPTAMIFIPSVGGISHLPHEKTEWEDIEKGANVLFNAVLKLAEIQNKD
ncbi:Zn-dependent hydrolase [Sporosarcina highlanderae]|uniref:Zn-dependent hydrolase n=1 Tax=Sporosarcina highlanderae TaxID=3035916 RepID=A0ABT8JVL2_9BACL|nr:Zn-dependent hydrolase [Sporosarcina highlanderae]MDN4609180.1 Zn-dependent hydrolase [Sporosarcina highlanderae]